MGHWGLFPEKTFSIHSISKICYEIFLFWKKAVWELKTNLELLLWIISFQNFGVLAIPTVPGPPPKLNTDISELYDFRAKAFSLLTIAAVSGVCQVLSLFLSKKLKQPLWCFFFWLSNLQVSIPLGLYDGLPVSISLLAKHGSDGFLLNVVDSLYSTLKEEVEAITEKDKRMLKQTTLIFENWCPFFRSEEWETMRYLIFHCFVYSLYDFESRERCW